MIEHLNQLAMLWDLMVDPVCDAAKWQPHGQSCHQLGLNILSA